MRITELAVEGFLWGEIGLSKAIPGVHILVGVNTLPHKELPSFSFVLVFGCYLKSLWRFAATSLSREASRNWALLMKRSCPREKEMSFSVLLGIQLTLLSTFEMACISRWESYPAGCETPRDVVVLGFSRSLRLQALWASPQYSPVMWQWSRTESPSRGLSHTWHVSAVRKASHSSRVIFMAVGSASTPLILHSASCSDS